MSIIIFSSQGCAQCEQVAATLASKDVPYEKVDIFADDIAMDVMQELRLRSVPQIFKRDGNTVVHLFDYKGLLKLTDEDFSKLK